MQPIIVGREGNQKMPLKDVPGVSRKHCILTDNLDGSFTVEDTSKLGTFVNGIQIIQTKVTPDTVIQLGPQFKVKVADLLPKLPPPPAQEFSLIPLRAVWDEYEQRKLGLQAENAKKANQQRYQGLLSTLGMVAGVIPGIPMILRIICMVASLGLGVFFLVRGSKTANSLPLQMKALDDEFRRRYKCPNPQCGRPFALTHYENIEYTPSCPACKCKYTH